VISSSANMTRQHEFSRIGRRELANAGSEFPLGNESRRSRRITFRRATTARQVEFMVKDNLAVQGDSGLLRIVMDPLSNAWKYTGKGASQNRVWFQNRSGKQHSTCAITAPDSI